MFVAASANRRPNCRASAGTAPIHELEPLAGRTQDRPGFMTASKRGERVPVLAAARNGLAHCAEGQADLPLAQAVGTAVIHEYGYDNTLVIERVS
jgi:hypothetical protein